MKISQKSKKTLDLSPKEANALMVMIESEVETVFAPSEFDPIADWEFADLYAYKLLAYYKFKQWYLENADD
tara:strand:+ start:2990 stop:3202 length:213 start_codon:yes stop_codon:yes gene_type:complete